LICYAVHTILCVSTGSILQALSKALTELRADMVTQAQEQVKAHGNNADQEVNVQKIVDKHTQQLVVGDRDHGSLLIS